MQCLNWITGLLQAVLVLNKLKKLQLDLWIIDLQFRHGNVFRLKQKSSLLIKRTIISIASIFGGGETGRHPK